MVGRAGEGRPLARALNRTTGIATMGKDDACALWSGRLAAGRVQLPPEITRTEITELCAARGASSGWWPSEGPASDVDVRRRRGPGRGRGGRRGGRRGRARENRQHRLLRGLDGVDAPAQLPDLAAVRP